MNPFRKELSKTEEFAREETKDLLGILKRIIRRDFSGNEGQAIKNSAYTLSSVLVAKIGSLFFTIILARMLLPELYGLYGLALYTIVLFGAFSDLGISTALITFMSRSFGEGKLKKAKGYYLYLLKYKLILVSIVSLILISSGYYLANFYYRKPIFYALLAGSPYIFFMSISGFFGGVFLAKNNFKKPFIKEVIFQLIRLTLVPLSILIFIGKISNEYLLSIIFLMLSFGFFISGFYLYFYLKKHRFFRLPPEKLSDNEKKKLKGFILPLSITALSGMFFGSIDMIMLGHFVESKFIGYYQAAFNLIGSAGALVGFSGSALFPILARLKKKRLEKGFKKSVRITFLIAFFGALFTFLFGRTIIQIVYGKAYLPSTLILQLFSLLIISAPVSGLYGTYYISQQHTKKYSILVILSTI
ncbi:flippase, partial [Candidatus Pacearchaeota archaeon]